MMNLMQKWNVNNKPVRHPAKLNLLEPTYYLLVMKLRTILALALLGNPLVYSTSFAGTVQTGTYGWTGTYSGTDNGSSLDSNLQGAGTRMLWYPGLGVFRAGLVESTYWDFSSLGDLSFGFGKNTVASGDFSFSMGQSYYLSAYSYTIPNTASGMNSFAFGRAAQATGAFSFAMGDIDTQYINSARATGQHAFSFGYGTSALSNYSLAFGYRSKTELYPHAVAIGYVAQAFGAYSFSAGYSTTVSSGATGAIAMGYESVAAKSHSVALGYSNMAGNSYSGVGSIALGFDTMALADYSFSAGYRTLADSNNSDDPNADATGPYSSMNAAFGNQTISRGNSCFVVGSFNHPSIFTASPDDLTRPLFVVGNGTSAATADRSNAFVVKANGDAILQGTLSMGGPLNLANGATIEQNLTVNGTIHCQPGGDVGMGEFGSYNP
ncbi:MAG: hypothetical protein SFY80_01870 [Verrucomicrobiota bacterium]|nr:hypothetical protein [Verrucomicrobiota bacterium]